MEVDKMRVAIAFVLLVALAAAPSAAATSGTTGYGVVYGPKDLGMWDTFERGTQKHGSYDGGNTFDSTDGPGFSTLTFRRPLTAADSKNFWNSLPAANGKVVVTEGQGGRVLATCANSRLFDFESTGDPGKGGIETIVIACVTIANGS